MGSKSHCIAMTPLYETSGTERKRLRKFEPTPIIPVSSTFYIERGVTTNRVRSRRPRRNPSCNILRRPVGDMD